jgi:tRNA modification GTPase
LGWAGRGDYSARDTIYALSTPPGRSAVAVIRLSGPRASKALEALTGKAFEPRVALYAAFRDPETKALLDRGLGLFFPAPASFTGEDCAEIQVHGSPPVVRAVCRSLSAIEGVREARPGEFTHRAFDAGKLRLHDVEALADLIDAQTDQQRRLALRATDGERGALVRRWRDRMIDALAAIEARLDFADEGDVDELDGSVLVGDLHALREEIGTEVARARRAQKVREGFYVAICGPPNSGKSTLLNALAGRDCAIVSPHPGTTRDVLEVNLELDGYLITICDTAGVRETDDAIEAVGIERARRAAQNADLTIWLGDPFSDDGLSSEAVDADLKVLSKADLRQDSRGDFQISAMTGFNLDRLISTVVQRAVYATSDGSDSLLATDRLTKAAGSVEDDVGEAARFFEQGRPELAAAHLGRALVGLDALGAPTEDEAVLDAIFGRFCIGK